jgi:hypothetical protein
MGQYPQGGAYGGNYQQVPQSDTLGNTPYMLARSWPMLCCCAIVSAVVVGGFSLYKGHEDAHAPDPTVAPTSGSHIATAASSAVTAAPASPVTQDPAAAAAKAAAKAAAATTAAPVVVTPAPAPTPPAARKNIDFYFEIGCPVCETLLKGVMQTVATKYAAAVNVRFHPWGNSFFGISECSSDLAAPPPSTANPDPRYTPAARECWGEKCAAGIASPAADCFSGNMICQHGPKACEIQAYAVCANKQAGDNWQKTLKYMTCVEKGFNMGTKYSWPKGSINMISKDCSTKAALDEAAIEQCASSGEGKQATQAEAQQTPKHKLVPYVLVDGESMEGIGSTPDMLINAIEMATKTRRLVV